MSDSAREVVVVACCPAFHYAAAVARCSEQGFHASRFINSPFPKSQLSGHNNSQCKLSVVDYFVVDYTILDCAVVAIY